MRHLSVDEMLDLAEGTRLMAAFPHLATCDWCRRQLADIQSAIAAAAGVDVPEPSPLFWDALSARVREAVTEAQRQRAGRLVAARGWRTAGFTAIAAAALIAAVAVPLKQRRTTEAGAAVRQPTTGGAAWSDGSSTANGNTPGEDPSLALLGDLAESLGPDTNITTALTFRTATLDGVLVELSEDERGELQRLLADAMKKPGA
jgi:hypothetical protein